MRCRVAAFLALRQSPDVAVSVMKLIILHRCLRRADRQAPPAGEEQDCQYGRGEGNHGAAAHHRRQAVDERQISEGVEAVARRSQRRTDGMGTLD